MSAPYTPAFPKVGDYYGVICSYMNDHSYRTDIFKCIASDENRVVGMRKTRNAGNPVILHRTEWKFEDVSALLPALGLYTKDHVDAIVAVEVAKARGEL
jgi:hypothetical protein